MQIFPCPFCGPRDETEFHYVGEPKARPEPAERGRRRRWAEYLYVNANPKGEAREIWLHLTCMEILRHDPRHGDQRGHRQRTLEGDAP